MTDPFRTYVCEDVDSCAGQDLRHASEPAPDGCPFCGGAMRMEGEVPA